MREMSIALLAASLVAVASTGHAAAPRSAGEGWALRHRPTRGLAELGLLGGAFLPRNHELYDPRRGYEPLRRAGPEFGLRFAYYPLAVLGLELESAVMPTRTTISASPATVIAVRAHAIAQLPYRLTPFVLLGYGALAQSGRRLGTDLDFGLHFGGGLKLFLNHWVALRLDLRSNLAARHGAQNVRTQHLELLLGLGVTLGRPPAPRRPAPPAPPSSVPQDRCSPGGPTTDVCPAAARPPEAPRP